MDSRTLPPATYVSLAAVKTDPAMAAGARGGRRVYVTEIWDAKEESASDVVWKHAGPRLKCPVFVSPNLEISTFNEGAVQDRHYHRLATEIYVLLEGSMSIEVDRKIYELSAGDMMVINPGTAHCVLKRTGDQFVCRVIAANCRGQLDKHPAPVVAGDL